MVLFLLGVAAFLTHSGSVLIEETFWMTADAVIRGTARLFVVCWFLRMCTDAQGRRDPSSQRLARWFWTVGCGIFVLHVVAAFHLVHGWSHAAAYEHVLQRSRQVAGFGSGIGLYVNYGFGLIWIFDTAIWWYRLRWSEQRIPYWTVQVLFAFLIGQATVVFGPRFWIPVGSIAVFMLTSLRIRRRIAGPRQSETLASSPLTGVPENSERQD